MYVNSELCHRAEKNSPLTGLLAIRRLPIDSSKSLQPNAKGQFDLGSKEAHRPFGLTSSDCFGSQLRRKGLPFVRTLAGTTVFHRLSHWRSSLASRKSSGSICGISSEIGYHRSHSGQTSKPSVISSFSSKT